MRYPIPIRPNKANQRGIMLLEALIAILIFSMGILAIVGLQAASIKNTATAKYRTDASYLANDIVGQMWGDTPNLATYPGGNAKKTAWLAKVAATLPAGEADIAVNGAVVTITVRWTPAGDNQHNFSTVAQIIGT